MRVYCLFFVFFLSVMSGFAFGQSGRLREANKLYYKMAYYHAAIAYEDVLERGVDSTYIARNLADCYDKIENNAKAALWYDHIERRSVLNQFQLIRYAMVLRQLRRYDASLEKLKQYESVFGATEFTQTKIAEHYLWKLYAEDSERYEIKNQERVNTESSDFGVSWFQSAQVLISAARPTSSLRRRTHDRVGDKFYGLSYSLIDDEGNLSPSKKIKGNTTFHDGPGIYDPINNFIYFTRSNYIKGKKGYDQSEVMRLKILRAELNSNGRLTNIIELPINGDNFSTGHPALTQDGKTLFFSSDRPGGFGGTDIWKVTIDVDGSTGVPVNLGKRVNTSQNELFPYVDSESNMLFFSSDGHTGLGGLDLFFGYLNSEMTSVSDLTNMAAPINSEFDDFGFIIDKALEKGYFVSNRHGGVGDDDIYSFKMLKNFEPFLTVEGVVSDCINKTLLDGVRISLQDAQGLEITNALIDTEGYFQFILNPSQQEYKLVANLEGYDELTERVSLDNLPQEIKVVRKDLCLGKNDDGLDLLTGKQLALEILVLDMVTKQPIPLSKISAYDLLSENYLVNDFTDDKGLYYTVIEHKRNLDDLIFAIRASKEGYSSKKIDYAGIYLNNDVIRVVIELEKGIFESSHQEIIDCDGNRIVLNNIYFDLDKYFIREQSKADIEKIIQLLNRCPEMKMEVGSHTDCRASYVYNDALSRRRARATVSYIKSRISNPQRIEARGYGERKLAEPCPCEPTNYSICSEEQHQLNRRTEFTILSVGQPNQQENKEKYTPIASSKSMNNAPRSNAETTDETYTIKEGETLYRVFVNTGVSVDELKRINKLSSNIVVVGQVIKLK